MAQKIGEGTSKTLMADVGKKLRGHYSTSEIEAYLKTIDKETYVMDYVDTNEAQEVVLKDNLSKSLSARTLVEVFKVEVLNLTDEDIEFYGTVELIADDYRSRFIYNRGSDESVLVKGNDIAYLLLNGPRSVFGLDCLELSFAAYLRDKRDGHLIHFGFSRHPSYLNEEIYNLTLIPSSLSYGGEEKTLITDEENQKMHALKMLLTYVVYDHAIAASVTVYILGEGGKTFPVYGFIFAASNLYPADLSCLFLKRENEAVLVDSGGVLELSKSLVAVPYKGSLTVEVVLPGIADMEIEFTAMQHLEEDVMDDGKIRVCVTWTLGPGHQIEAVEEGEVSLPPALC